MVAERRDPDSPMHKVVEDLLHKLEPIESYWAFPGRVTFERLHTMFEEQEFTTLAHTVARITRALMSDSYRSRHIHVIPTEDDEDSEERSDTAEERARNRPYFEVMIVDDLSPHQ